MTHNAKKAVRSIGRKMERNARAIEKRLSSSNAKPDFAIIRSIAKYQEALERLARE